MYIILINNNHSSASLPLTLANTDKQNEEWRPISSHAPSPHHHYIDSPTDEYNITINLHSSHQSSSSSSNHKQHQLVVLLTPTPTPATPRRQWCCAACGWRSCLWWSWRSLWIINTQEPTTPQAAQHHHLLQPQAEAVSIVSSAWGLFVACGWSPLNHKYYNQPQAKQQQYAERSRGQLVETPVPSGRSSAKRLDASVPTYHWWCRLSVYIILDSVEVSWATAGGSEDELRLFY